mmetsp:Transcript_61525/g.144079  ORF Transcript_61525/g.144079 Transcript_61525/m.144079 type:complete len:246 (-) Transcript_61525:103-840(-)
MRAHSIDPSLRRKVPDRFNDFDQTAASIKHVVHNNDVRRVQGCIRNDLHLADFACFGPELVGHHKPDLQLIGHFPGPLGAARIGGTHQCLLWFEAWDRFPNKCSEVLLAGQLIKRSLCWAEASFGLVVQVNRDETVCPCSCHQVQQELRGDGFSSLELSILPGILNAGQYHGDTVRRLGLQCVQHDQQLHEHEVDLALKVISRTNHEHIIIGYRLLQLHGDLSIRKSAEAGLPYGPAQVGNGLLA